MKMQFPGAGAMPSQPLPFPTLPEPPDISVPFSCPASQRANSPDVARNARLLGDTRLFDPSFRDSQGISVSTLWAA